MVFINNREQKLFHAVTFDNSRPAADEPLLGPYDHVEDEIDNDDGYANDYNIIIQQATNGTNQGIVDSIIFRRYKIAALVIGLLVGIGIQFATLWANILFIHQWGGGSRSDGGVDNNASLSSSQQQQQQQQDVVALFALIWSFITSVTAVIILACLRNFVQKSYFTTLKTTTTDDMIQEMMLQLEVRFVVSALIGVCMAWSITDALMGMPKQIILSLIILVVALAWCRIIMSFLVVGNNNNNNKTPSSSYPPRYPACRHTTTTTRSSLLTTTSEIPIV